VNISDRVSTKPDNNHRTAITKLQTIAPPKEQTVTRKPTRSRTNTPRNQENKRGQSASMWPFPIRILSAIRALHRTNGPSMRPRGRNDGHGVRITPMRNVPADYVRQPASRQVQAQTNCLAHRESRWWTAKAPGATRLLTDARLVLHCTPVASRRSKFQRILHSSWPVAPFMARTLVKRGNGQGPLLPGPRLLIRRAVQPRPALSRIKP